MEQGKKDQLEDFSSSAKACWRTVRAPCPSPVQVTVDELDNQRLTADPVVLHRQLWQAWEPIFRRLSSFCLDNFQQKYEEQISFSSELSGEWSFTMPSAKSLHARASKLADDSSTGPDGRAPVELKRLPRWIWEHVSVFWKLIFEHGAPWP
jgi:hypothetical protein